MAMLFTLASPFALAWIDLHNSSYSYQVVWFLKSNEKVGADPYLADRLSKAAAFSTSSTRMSLKPFFTRLSQKASPVGVAAPVTTA